MLKLITAPAVEPVTADEVKEHTHITHDVEDLLVGRWITAARIAAENHQRRAYISQVWELSFDTWPEVPFDSPRPPLINILSIKYIDYLGVENPLYDSAVPVITNSNFIIDTGSEPGRIGLAYNVAWPGVTLQTINSVKIRFTAGYGTAAVNVHENIKSAITLYCSYANENRAAEVPEPPKWFFWLIDQERNFL